MATDAERIAEVIGDGHFQPPTHKTSGPCCMTPQAIQQIADALTQAGFGHVPIALHHAADAWQQGGWANTPRHAERAQDRIAAANYVGRWLRARADRTRADRTGGTA